MTESQETTTADGNPSLLHLSNVSFLPTDVVSVYWQMNQEFSKNLLTRIRTRHEVFVLESDSPSYQDDIELLENALGR